MIKTYTRIGEEGRLKALEIVNTLPGIDYSKELRLANVLTGDNKKQRLQENILLLLRLINNNFSYRLIEFYDNIEEKIEILKKNINLIELVVGKNLYRFNIPCKNFAFDIASCYGKKEDQENTLYWLNKSLNYAQALDNVPNEGKYDSYWINDANYSFPKIENYDGQEKMFDITSFDFIRDTDEFKNIKNKYLKLYGINV